MQEIGAGIIGLGFMGRTHLAAYEHARRLGHPCSVRGVFGITASAPSGNLATGASSELPPGARTYTSASDLLADPSIHVVSICTPTDTHAELVTQALRARKHVLVEKPVALSVEAIDALVVEARAAGRLCMPAMCMRFWPGWSWLKEKAASGEFGRVVSARFERVGSRPAWSRDFYLDAARSGGALWDLHIHDADVIHWLFGMPTSVRSAGVVHKRSGVQQISTQYAYEAGPAIVTAEGGWVADAGFPFRMRYTVVFDGKGARAGGAGSGEIVADWDLSRTPHLAVTRGGVCTPVEIDGPSGYEGEVLAFFDAVRTGQAVAPATLEEAAEVARLLKAEEESVRSGREVRL